MYRQTQVANWFYRYAPFCLYHPLRNNFSLQRFHTLIVPVYLTFFKGLNLKKKKRK